jgi:DNA helicase-2/ATP-dependent DNA helicase PcrA
VVACLQDQEEEAEFSARVASDDFPGTTAILYRMNAQSLHFETCFRQHGIPFRLIGTVRFYSREEVKDALAYLALLVNRDDEVSFRRIVNKPGRGVGAATVEKIMGEWKGRAGEHLLDTCRRVASRLSARTRTGLLSLLATLEELGSRMRDTPLAELARLMMSRTGLYDMYRIRDRSDGTAKSENLEEMVSDMASYGPGEDGLSQFLESVALASPLDAAGGEEGAKVTLITLHNTKGLEFDRVIITGLEEGIFPHDSSSTSPDDLEEERRLFYVGVTRARERLLMTWCLNRRIFGRTTAMAPSRFLDEIPSEAVTRIGGDGEEETKDEYPVGSGVFHDEYGPGVVERKWYSDGALLVQVRFQSGRVAKLLPKYARLERIDLGD